MKEVDEIEMRKIEHTKDLLAIPAEERTEKQLLELMSFTKKLHLFENIAMSEEHEQICRTMLLIHFKPNETIVKQGDVGDSFFHILTGIVKIVVSKKLDFGADSGNEITVDVFIFFILRNIWEILKQVRHLESYRYYTELKDLRLLLQ